MSRLFTDPVRQSVVTVVERLGGSAVIPMMRELEKTERLDRPALLEFQWRKFKKLLDHAHKYVPYYRRLLDGIGMGPGDFVSREDIARIPILTKKLVRENLDDLQATGSDAPMQVLEAQTGGTTGEPLKFKRDAACISYTRAALLRSYVWTGYRIGDPMLFFTGGSLLAAPQTFKQRFGFKLMNYHFIPGFKLRRETLPDYVDAVRANNIKFIRGYSTLLHQFAALCEEVGVADLHVEGVFPTAEMLTRAQRDTIERVLHCKIYDHYGCAEVNALANECPEGRRFHVIDEHVIMEETASEVTGENALVITDLDNYAQPFIRYANADRGRLTDEFCKCGRNLTVLDEFLGRSSDAIVLKSGERYPGIFFHHLFGHFAGVTQFQIVQDKAGEMRVRIVKNARYAANDEAEIKRLIGEHTLIDPTIEYTDAIERAGSGKITSVICNVE